MPSSGSARSVVVCAVGDTHGRLDDMLALVDALEDWRDAVLEGRSLDREARKRIHAHLAEQPRARRLLMAALAGQDLGPMLDALLDDGWSGAELHRVIDARPDAARLRELL